MEASKDKFYAQSDRLETWSELSLACRPQQNIPKRIAADTAVPNQKSFMFTCPAISSLLSKQHRTPTKIE